MRLAGPLFETYNTPHEWIAALERLNYRAADCPQIPSGFLQADQKVTRLTPQKAENY